MRYQFISSRQLGSIIPNSHEANSTLIVMPFLDPALALNTARQLTQRANTGGLLLCVHDDERGGGISLVNRLFLKSTHQRFGYVAQDAFAGRQWLSLALNVFVEQKPGLFAFNDGKWQGELASFGLVDREWAQKNYGGNLFHPGYHSHYADVELSLLARNDGRYAYDPNSVLVEVDPEKDSKPVNREDRALFLKRKRFGFDKRITNTELLEKFE